MEWKPVVGYEGLYEVSESGLVKSLEREKFCGHEGSKPQITKEKILKERICKMGYPVVSLSKDSKAKSVRVHRILALAFIPNPENKPCVNHIDNNPMNKSLDNLEWCTQKENMQHASKQGRMFSHQDKTLYRRNTKIDMDIARKIREDRKEGNSLIYISEKYEVSASTVSMICNNKIWKEVY